MKKSNEVAQAVSDERNCLKCGETGHVKKDCPEKDLNDDLNDKCPLCKRKDHDTTSCWENPENAAKHPKGYKPKLSIDEGKKRMTKANKSKIEIQGAFDEVNKFSCINVDINSEENDNKVSLQLKNHLEQDLNPGRVKILTKRRTKREKTGVMRNQL